MKPPFIEPISEQIWQEKYRYSDSKTVIDQSVSDTWARVAKHIASVENDAKHWQQQFYDALTDFKFLPGGRILAGAGTLHNVTLFNCFVMDIEEDSLTGIFNALKECALTLQQGGGVGYDFSVLRPEGDWTKAGVHASGPVSFMRIWDTTCSIMLSTGARRGAMMGVMRCDHPDIETFISAKRDARELRHFNVSVMVSDAFIEAVKSDADWPLVFPSEKMEGEIVYRQWGKALTPVACRVYKRVKARALWEQIKRSAYDYAEPGVLFHDTINELNPLYYCERINATNPCGEIPLPPYGACDLGAINLTQFISQPFTPQAAIKWGELEHVAVVATRFLDNVVDASRYPLAMQREQALGSRRIGLGLTGLADLFVMLGVPYGSDASVRLAQDIMQQISTTTWLTSIALAEEKGCFPFYNKAYLKGKFVQQLPTDIILSLEKNGCRNSHHNTIAPTGTISLLANNVANGIEPIFHPAYDRKIRTGDGNMRTERVHNYTYRAWQAQQPAQDLPPAWRDVSNLTPQEHLRIQAAMQPFIDNAISKTINLPENFPFAELGDVYMQAYESQLKGCTVYRPNPTTGSVLSVPEERCCQLDDTGECESC